ncbi:MAG: DUF4197 domain-containing protein [Bernardetiaceae bacterium]
MKKTVQVLFLIWAVLGLSTACTTQQITQAVGVLTNVPLSKEEAGQALKDALIQGITKGTGLASQEGGYLNNALIRIPFPPETERVANTLRDIGLGGEVDKFVRSLNRGAEEAAKEALPIFKQAIVQLSFQDAFAILRNESKIAATDYLQRTTTTQLQAVFQPIVQRNLDKVNATKFYGELVDRYNRIPLVKKANPDLEAYATERAIAGLFQLVAQEEQNIRTNLSARSTELMRKAFAQQD